MRKASIIQCPLEAKNPILHHKLACTVAIQTQHETTCSPSSARSHPVFTGMLTWLRLDVPEIIKNKRESTGPIALEILVMGAGGGGARMAIEDRDIRDCDIWFILFLSYYIGRNGKCRVSYDGSLE